MKKIILLANNDVGLYNFRKELLVALLAVPYEVHIALPYGSNVDKMEEMGCIYHETKMDRRGTNPLQELRLLKRYGTILKKVRPNVVLTYTIKPNIYGGILCASKKIPYITNITGLGTAVEGEGLLQKFTIAMYRFAMRKVTNLFFQNETNEQYFNKKKIALGKHTIIPGSGVNLERYQYLEYPTTGSTEFLFISRVMKEKGIEQYIETAKIIREKYPDTVFHILGFCEDDDHKPDSYKKRLEVLEGEDIIKFQGMQEDIKPYL
ncbi:MAG TPA: glycosyltransferase, partial [Lachnospiraceae bacterium]|nr:glycosyltransferase [Lachnospiraceae bacterium]